jgi:DNA-binding HxlR family transcriptional regulator
MGQVLDGNQMREASCQKELRAMRDALDILGGKWKLMILRYLANRESQEIHFKKWNGRFRIFKSVDERT